MFSTFLITLQVFQHLGFALLKLLSLIPYILCKSKFFTGLETDVSCLWSEKAEHRQYCKYLSLRYLITSDLEQPPPGRMINTVVSVVTYWLPLKAHGQDCVNGDCLQEGQWSKQSDCFIFAPNNIFLKSIAKKNSNVTLSLLCHVNSNVLNRNFFSLVPEYQIYVLLTYCWTTSIANTSWSNRRTTFYIFGNCAMPTSWEFLS